MEEKSSQKAYERVFDYFTAEITSGSLRLNDKIRRSVLCRKT
ncbi:MAG: hypothetical protein V8S58_08320 [Lachnospiraceae bacterium]